MCETFDQHCKMEKYQNSSFLSDDYRQKIKWPAFKQYTNIYVPKAVFMSGHWVPVQHFDISWIYKILIETHSCMDQ